MTPITPPPGLLDKVAEAMHEGLPCDKHRDGECAYMPKARAAWDAVVEGLGLTEKRRTLADGSAWQTIGADGVIRSGGQAPTTQRRLVSRWEPKP